jgi:integrase/recombinase XerD
MASSLLPQALPDLNPSAAPLGKRKSPALAGRSQENLAAWFHRYLAEEAGANAANTFRAKSRDLSQFLHFLADQLRSDHPDDWTKSITAAFLRRLEGQRRKPATANRVLSTLRHAASWIHERRPFLAGHPCRGIQELVMDEPAWKGLSDVEVMRLRSACEQLAALKNRKNQHAVRDRAIFLVLLHTGLRISELLALDRRQYQGKHFTDVRRKGKVRTAKVFLPPEAREALDAYLTEERGEEAGPLFRSRAGEPLQRQHVDRLLKQLAAQASSKLPKDEHVRLSAHVLRHTFLRRVTEKHGVQFAMEAAGHASSKYIWRYVKPSEEQREKALEELF